jgi:hypothetical protein
MRERSHLSTRNMTEEEVVRVLGPPGDHGPGRIAYYRSAKTVKAFRFAASVEYQLPSKEWSVGENAIRVGFTPEGRVAWAELVRVYRESRVQKLRDWLQIE